MIITPRFVFLHLHKSGGTFVNACLLQFVIGAKQVGYHLPRSMIPPEARHLPILGFVRSPWSYYVSWYSFQRSRPEPNALFRTLSEGGRLGFAATIGNMLRLGEDDTLLDRVLSALPADYTNRGLNLPATALAGIRASGLGFYAFLYRYLYGTPDDVMMGRMEALRIELPEMLERVGEPVDSRLRALIERAPALNSSEHGAVSEHYDDRLARLVAERDAEVIRRYGYRFE